MLLTALDEEKFCTKTSYTQRSINHPMMSKEVQKSVNLTVAAVRFALMFSLDVSRSSSVKANYQNDLSEELLIFFGR